jgi:CheY-like chemotaxis protein
MAQLLVINDTPDAQVALGSLLEAAGHQVVTASTGLQGLEIIERHRLDGVLSALRLPDISGLDVLRYLKDRHSTIPFMVVAMFGSTRDAVAAMRLGAADFLEGPLLEYRLVRRVEAMLTNRPQGRDTPSSADMAVVSQAHAAARWARALVPLVQAPSDPRTLAAWARIVFVSSGALRTWCRMAGIPPRRSLVFARLLRAVVKSRDGAHRPEDFLDGLDRRTLVGLLRLAGLNTGTDFPGDVDAYLRRQLLVRDPETLLEIRRTLASSGALR